MKTKEDWINELGLIAHPEGGFYQRTEESKKMYAVESDKNRHLYTSIYFLLTPDSPSHFHRLIADEIWYFHEGQTLTVHCIYPDGQYAEVDLGKEQGNRLHFVVPAGTIFGSTVKRGYALVSCAVIPGFDFQDFELFTQSQLLEKYPQHQQIIEKLAYKELPNEN
ncbi:cupin domain-containing protein [Vagococcus vulneris]|uniref:Cupin n=1 Tax=Vagococcus vulneris TaxID=1977869 RepID=A0A430A169_9ENTE|nr:cupin domain-containing protein [Vagococcus vulneris]RSU00155.1 cupin [Vagococcus vulneris]